MRKKRKNHPHVEHNPTQAPNNQPPSAGTSTTCLPPTDPREQTAPSSRGIDILTPEQFGERMQISRATVFNLMKKGILLPGVHYIRWERTVRFPWSWQLINNLLQASKTPEPDPVEAAKPPRKPGRSKNPTPINWEY